jgi:hypothetical protein
VGLAAVEMLVLLVAALVTLAQPILAVAVAREARQVSL